MNIPHLGRLFRDHETEIRESELIVFIRPELVCDCEICHPREDMARENCETNLDRIPHAEDVQFIPYCQDKNCPYHCPRPRINGGSQDLGATGSRIYDNFQFDRSPSETNMPSSSKRVEAPSAASSSQQFKSDDEIMSRFEILPASDAGHNDAGHNDAEQYPHEFNREGDLEQPFQE